MSPYRLQQQVERVWETVSAPNIVPVIRESFEMWLNESGGRLSRGYLQQSHHVISFISSSSSFLFKFFSSSKYSERATYEWRIFVSERAERVFPCYQYWVSPSWAPRCRMEVGAIRVWQAAASVTGQPCGKMIPGVRQGMMRERVDIWHYYWQIKQVRSKTQERWWPAGKTRHTHTHRHSSFWSICVIFIALLLDLTMTMHTRDTSKKKLCFKIPLFHISPTLLFVFGWQIRCKWGKTNAECKWYGLCYCSLLESRMCRGGARTGPAMPPTYIN